MTLDPDYRVVARVLLLLAGVPEAQRLDTVAVIFKFVVERPEWVALLKDHPAATRGGGE